MEIRLAKQVHKDLRKETAEIQEKLVILLDSLSKGATLSMPVSRNMIGHPGLKELRLKDSRGIVRVFYYIVKGDAIYLLHLFRKKTQKTPPKEIELALKRLKSMLE